MILIIETWSEKCIYRSVESILNIEVFSDVI